VEQVISFARGVPAPECLAEEELADCARTVLDRDGKTILSYGSGAGYAPLREMIAGWFGVTPTRVILTNGALQGFVMLSQHFGPGATVLVELPTYDRPLKIMAEAAQTVVAVPMDEQGLVPEELERALAASPDPAFLYTIPTFQNPSGRTLPEDRRRRVVELADAASLLIVEDDPYGMIRFEGERVPSLFELAGGTIIYTSSFSKTIAPGLRVGFYIVPDELAGPLTDRANSTYITPALLSEAVVHEFISRGRFEPNLERVNGLLKLRRDAMLAALAKHLSGTTWSHPGGGYFVWLELPEGTVASEVVKRAAGVTAVLGTDFGGAPNTLRLAYSYVSPDEIDEGVSRLAVAV
jgi:DNA-binding transcriptional MocR family regulator